MNKVDSLKAAVAQQPVVVLVDSSSDAFKYYKGGIISDAKACGTMTDEPLLVVGYGKDEDAGMEYWLVKNNYGTDWGEDGYLRVAINGDGPGVCGIQTSCYFAVTK